MDYSMMLTIGVIMNCSHIRYVYVCMDVCVGVEALMMYDACHVLQDAVIKKAEELVEDLKKRIG